MWQRWRQVGYVAAGLFAINILVRLVSLPVDDDNTKLLDRLGLAGFVLPGVAVAVLTYLGARRYPLIRVVLDLGVAIAAGCLLSVLVGPLVTGDGPFSDGAGFFFGQIWLYLGIALAGVAVGVIVVMALGQDYRSQALKRYAQNERARPHRPVRR